MVLHAPTHPLVPPDRPWRAQVVPTPPVAPPMPIPPVEQPDPTPPAIDDPIPGETPPPMHEPPAPAPPMA